MNLKKVRTLKERKKKKTLKTKSLIVLTKRAMNLKGKEKRGKTKINLKIKLCLMESRIKKKAKHQTIHC